MCVYCMIGDDYFRRNPPWDRQRDWPQHPAIPAPAPFVPMPIVPWPIEELRKFEDLLRRVKELEDKLGCPCEPNKADYLGMVRERIERLEKAAKKRRPSRAKQPGATSQRPRA